MKIEGSNVNDNEESSGGNFLSDFVDNIRESLGVEPSTSADAGNAADADDLNSGHLESALSDRLNQDQVTKLKKNKKLK